MSKKKNRHAWTRDYPSVYTYKADRRLKIVGICGEYSIYWRGMLMSTVTTTLKLAKERAFELVGDKLYG